MAVLIVAYSVIVRKSTIAANYAGGMAAFQRDCPNATLCCDEHLARISFMVQHDADIFIAQLAAKGLTPFRNDAAQDVALVSPEEGLLKPCAWLTLERRGRAVIGSLAGTAPGDVHLLEGAMERPMHWHC